MNQELIKRTEDRIREKLSSSSSTLDLKIDLLEYIKSSTNAISNEVDESHTFKLETIGESDCLLMQVPNINESGYYAGIVALKSYVDKFHSDLNVEIIDPIIDYFYLNPPNKESEFFNLLNTYTKQGEYHLLYDHQEFWDMFNGFVCSYIEKSNPAFFGLSIIDGNMDASIAMARLIKEKYPHIKILFGGNGIEILDFGVLPNLRYETKNYTFIDFFVRGDGEITFVEILKSDLSKESVQNIKGVIWWNDGELTFNNQRDNINIDTLPFPDYSSLEDNYYYKNAYQNNVPLVLSRGCPYRCSFCSVPEFIPTFRYRPVENVLDEMEYWIKKDRRVFFCHDSIINGNPKWLETFCKEIIKRGWGDDYVMWGGNMRLQKPMRDLDTMRMYRKAGLSKMITGFESASEPVLKHMKKYTNMEGVREIFENVRTINKENDFPMLFAMQLIIGYLNETKIDFQRTVDFVKEYHDTFSEILTCSAFLLHETLKNKWIDSGEYIEFHNTVNFNTNYNTAEERLGWINEIENTFKECNLKYNIYNRGLYYDLKDTVDEYVNEDWHVSVWNIENKTKKIL